MTVGHPFKKKVEEKLSSGTKYDLDLVAFSSLVFFVGLIFIIVIFIFILFSFAMEFFFETKIINCYKKSTTIGLDDSFNFKYFVF